MILLDSNVIVYSLDTSSPKRLVAQKYILDNKNLCVSHQNIVESYRILTHQKSINPMTHDEAIDALIEFQSFLPVILPRNSTLDLFLQLMTSFEKKSLFVFDTYLCATMISNGIKMIATENVKDFELFDDIEVINPFEGM